MSSTSSIFNYLHTHAIQVEKYLQKVVQELDQLNPSEKRSTDESSVIVTEEVDQKEKEAELKRITHIQSIAKRHLALLEAMYYRPDGQLSNEIEYRKTYENFWGTRGKNNDPQKLRERADQLEKTGSLEQATALRETASINESEREEFMKDFQKTLFPVVIDYEPYRLEDLIKKVENLDLTLPLYYRTTEENAAKILVSKGFEDEIPALNNWGNLGSGIDLISEREVAINGYNKKNPKGLLKVAVQLDKGKIARASISHIHFLASTYFYKMVEHYVRVNLESINQDFEACGLEKEKHASAHPLTCPLQQLFIRSFFEKLGYQAVLARGWTGLDRLHVFRKENIASVELAGC